MGGIEFLLGHPLLFVVLGCLALLVLIILLLLTIHVSTRMPGEATNQLPAAGLGDNVKQDARILRRHVKYLADDLGPRSLEQYDNLAAAAHYIEQEFRALGYDIELQEYSPGGYARSVVNVQAERRGTLRAEEVVIVGAHYDSIGAHCPGADDNASGVAGLLWLAQKCKEMTPTRTLRFVAFTNEEPPHFKKSTMGSYQYAKAVKGRNEKVKAFICLESLGFYSEYPETQKYPFPLSWWYPNKGNFVGFVGNWKSSAILRQAIQTFRTVSSVPSYGFAGPSWFPGVSWSDHWSFWKMGYPAFMITDTAPFRNQYYHTENDRWDTLDYTTFASLMPGIQAVVADVLRAET